VVKKLGVIAVIVIFAVAMLQFSLNPPRIEALNGAGISQAAVIGGVVILAGLLGYYLWTTSQRQRL
jgi:hypothetical protein